MLELHAIVFGNVQGVGFRATCRRIARDMKLNGYVRNLPNGSVEICAQGTKEDLEKLLDSLRKSFGPYIKDMVIEYRQPSSNFDGFDDDA